MTINIEGQFIPVSRVLETFLSLPGFLEIVLNHLDYLYNEIGKEYMCNIVHGKLSGEIREKDESKIVLPLALYFDEFEPNISLGFYTVVDKIGTTYFMLPTLSPQFQSTLKHIFLALLFRNYDRNFFGNFAVLLDALIDLEVNGLLINGVRVYFVCVVVTGDNLGIHQICGFIEGFLANHPCLVCISKEQLRNDTVENSSLLRKYADYEKNLQLHVSETGLTKYCIWNYLPSYHAQKNFF